MFFQDVFSSQIKIKKREPYLMEKRELKKKRIEIIKKTIPISFDYWDLLLLNFVVLMKL